MKLLVSSLLRLSTLSAVVCALLPMLATSVVTSRRAGFVTVKEPGLSFLKHSTLPKLLSPTGPSLCNGFSALEHDLDQSRDCSDEKKGQLRGDAADSVSKHRPEHHQEVSPSPMNWWKTFKFSPTRFEDIHIYIRGRNERSWTPKEGENARQFFNRCNQQIDILLDGGYLTKEGASTLINSITTYYENAVEGRDNKELLEEIKGIVKRYVAEYPGITQYESGIDEGTVSSGTVVLDSGGTIKYHVQDKVITKDFHSLSDAVKVITKQLREIGPYGNISVQPSDPTKANAEQARRELSYALQGQPCRLFLHRFELENYVDVQHDGHDRRRIGLKDALN